MLGERLHLTGLALGGSRDCTVIGIVADAPISAMREDPRPAIYLPLISTHTPDSAILLIRGPRDAVASSVDHVERNDGIISTPREPIAVESEVIDQLGRERALAWVGVVFGSLATFVSLFSAFVVASSALQVQKREINIRLALGATRGRMLRLLTSQFGKVPAIGSVLGSVSAYFTIAKFGSLIVYSSGQLNEIALTSSIIMIALLGCALLRIVIVGSNPILDSQQLRGQ